MKLKPATPSHMYTYTHKHTITNDEKITLSDKLGTSTRERKKLSWSQEHILDLLKK